MKQNPWHQVPNIIFGYIMVKFYSDKKLTFNFIIKMYLPVTKAKGQEIFYKQNIISWLQSHQISMKIILHIVWWLKFKRISGQNSWRFLSLG